MAYQTPELLLVGAAQNLVLSVSLFAPTPLKNEPGNCGTEEATGDNYEAAAEW